jgi:hypothetical protein
VVSWCRGPRLSGPSPDERSRPALLDIVAPMVAYALVAELDGGSA